MGNESTASKADNVGSNALGGGNDAVDGLSNCRMASDDDVDVAGYDSESKLTARPNKVRVVAVAL